VLHALFPAPKIESEHPLVKEKEDLEARFRRVARFYEPRPDGKVHCRLCPHSCIIADQQRGLCGVRENRFGQLFTLVHSRVSAAHVDPIEKKPLFNFLPGSKAFSFAAPGCNLRCHYCQNWESSQVRAEDLPSNYAPPAHLASIARETGCKSLAYTYTEPTVFAEFAMDTADEGHKLGLKSVVVSNGFMQTEAVHEAWGRMDAVKIDLKAFSESFYRDVAEGQLRPVLDTLLTLRTMGKWIEIVYLLIPGLNDSEAELKAMVRWVRSDLGPDVPLHFTRYYPDYMLRTIACTPVARLELARGIALAEGLNYVYIGNVPGHAAQNTLCPGCKMPVIERESFNLLEMKVSADGRCPYCGTSIAGVWHS